MNIMGIGTVSSYIKGLTLNMKGQERMNNLGKQKKDEEIDPKIAEMKRWVENERRGQAIASIKSKMMSGSYLTGEERDYLKSNCPELYEEAEKIEREREAYKKALEKCKSKEDVDKLYQQKMDSFYSEAKQIMGNPQIPKLKKAIMLEYITMRMNAVGNDHRKFVESENYNSLPDEKYEKKKSEDDPANSMEQTNDANIADDVENTEGTSGSDTSLEDGSLGSEDKAENDESDPTKAIHEMRENVLAPNTKKKHREFANKIGTAPHMKDITGIYAKHRTPYDTGTHGKSKSKTSVSV